MKEFDIYRPTYLVSEIFLSVDGEGVTAGRPAVFIRLFGCNLRCKECDSMYSVEMASEGALYKKMELCDLIREVNEYDCPYVTLTGGEPLIAKDSDLLVEALIKSGHLVNIETNGSVDVNEFNSRLDLDEDDKNKLLYTIDFKCPSTGMMDNMVMKNYAFPTGYPTVIKFVVADEEDLICMLDVIRAFDLMNRTDITAIYVGPMYGRITPDEIVTFIKENRLWNVFVQIQLHKVFWPNTVKGV